MNQQHFTWLLICAVNIGALVARAQADVIQSNWTGNGATNAWTDTGNWSSSPSGPPAYPNNTITNTYQATIGVTGADAHLSANVTVDSVTLDLNPTLTVESSGQLNVVSGMQISDGNFNVVGGFSVGTFGMSSGNCNFSGTFSATTASIDGGILAVSTGGHVSTSSLSVTGSLLLKDGDVTSTNPVSVHDFGLLNGSGTITGGASIGTDGELSPGAFEPPTLTNGTVHVNGDLNVSSGGAISFDLASPAASGDFDKVAVNGTAMLGGFLAVRVFDDWVSSGAGETFTILSATNLINSGIDYTHASGFDRIVVTNESSDEVGSFHVLIDSTSLSLSDFEPVPEPGALGAFAILAAGSRRLSKRQKHRRRR
jgi:hypothetical protein